MKKPEKPDFERVKTAADAECVQLAIQTDINAIVREYVERKLAEFPQEAENEQTTKSG